MHGRGGRDADTGWGPRGRLEAPISELVEADHRARSQLATGAQGQAQQSRRRNRVKGFSDNRVAHRAHEPGAASACSAPGRRRRLENIVIGSALERPRRVDNGVYKSTTG
jgi:hypothetical protein